MNKEDISKEILTFIQNYYSLANLEITYNCDLFNLLKLDSMDLIIIIQHLESTYNIRIRRSDLIAENFNTINNISQHILSSWHPETHK